MKTTNKKTITENQRIQLIGLLALAAKQIKLLKELEVAALEITGEKDNCGHTGDAIFEGGKRSVDDLLERLGIVVKKR